jgi:Zn-dependent peptidase ImmA (M78 family)
VKIADLARQLGLRVSVSNGLDPNISGQIKRDNEAEGGYHIILNKFEGKERQRFTIAHEIAHFLLHREKIDEGNGIVDNVMYRSQLSNRMEVEANQLAADLIMPRHLIHEQIREIGANDQDYLISELARRFRVSEQAMRIQYGR